MTASRSPPQDVKCTWDMLTRQSRARSCALNPRKAWYRNLDDVTTNGDYEVTFHAEAAAAGISDAARDRHVAGLSVPCAAARHAHAIRSAPARSNSSSSSRTNTSGWPRTRITGSRAGPISTASSGRSSRTARPQTLGVYRRQVRHDLSLRGDGAVDARHQEPGARGDLRADADAGRDQPARQPRRAAVRRPRYPPGDAADHRPQELHRHPRRGPGRHQRRDAAAARRAVGPAARNAADSAGLWPRCRRPTAPRRAN